VSDIKLKRKHGLGLKKARVAAQKVADDLSSEFGMTSEWDGDVLRFNRSGVHGELHVSRDEVHLDARLGLLLSAFKPKIEEHINNNFDRYFV
jgi:putative polyhydroxyalkanoate system protein